MDLAAIHGLYSGERPICTFNEVTTPDMVGAVSTAEHLAASIDSVALAATLPLAVLALAFVGYCLFDLYRSPVKYLPKWAWAVICLVSVPFGGVVYLLVGRDHR
jgi:hypothetical protein